MNIKLQSPRGQRQHNQAESEVLEPSSQKIDRTVEMLCEQAREQCRTNAPRFIREGRACETDYVAFLGNCLETIVTHLRSQAPDANSDQEVADLSVRCKDCAGEQIDILLREMSLNITATSTLVNFLLYMPNNAQPAVTACVQDRPFTREQDNQEAKKQWTLVAVLVAGNQSLTDLSLNVSVKTPFSIGDK